MANFSVEMFKTDDDTEFYVRPFSEEIKMELDRLMVNIPKVSKNTFITEHNGTYVISTDVEIDQKSFNESLWGILFRRFYVEAQRVCVDPITEEKFYAVIFSEQFIYPCERLMAA